MALVTPSFGQWQSVTTSHECNAVANARGAVDSSAVAQTMAHAQADASSTSRRADGEGGLQTKHEGSHYLPSLSTIYVPRGDDEVEEEIELLPAGGPKALAIVIVANKAIVAMFTRLFLFLFYL